MKIRRFLPAGLILASVATFTAFLFTGTAGWLLGTVALVAVQQWNWRHTQRSTGTEQGR